MGHKKDNPLLSKNGVSYALPFAMVVSCFALWGLLNNMTDNLVPAFARIFMIDAVDSSLVQVAFYGAYAVLAIPAALLVRKHSYRMGVLIGLGLYIVGAMGYVPAAMLQSYELFLVSIFVLACGLSVLETTCNPFVLSLGAEETAIQRLNLAQAFNPIGSLTGIFLAKYMILAHLDSATVAERLAMPSEALAAIQSTELFWVCVPYVGLVLLALAIWFFFFRSHALDSYAEKSELRLASDFSKLLHSPRYLWGVVAQFFYVGLQISVWTWTVKYAMTVFGVCEADAAQYYIYSIVLFIACRWLCTWLIKRMAPGLLLLLFAVAGLCATAGVVYLPTACSIWALVAVSGCMSLMFPTIYGLALRGLGEEVKLGAAGLIMAILGGAMLPPLMGQAIDSGMLAWLVPACTGEEAAIRSSFYIPAACFVVVAVYGSMNLRNR